MPETENGFWPDEPAATWLLEREKVVPFLGAGISQAAGLPDAGQLGVWISQTFPPRDGPYRDPTHLFGTVAQADVEPGYFEEQVAAHIGAFALIPTPVTEALVQIRSKLIITLNYDLLLEHSAVARGLNVVTLLNDEQGLSDAFNLLSNRNRWPPEHLTVLHLHGCVTDPTSLVLSDDSFSSLQSRGRFQDLMLWLTRDKTMCFMGSKLDEVHLLSELMRNAGDQGHVLLCPTTEVEELVGGRAPLGPRQNISLCGYTDLADVVAFAQRLVEDDRPEIPAQPSAKSFSRKGHDPYVPASLSERPLPGREQQEPDLAYLLTQAGDLPPGPSEADIALGQRTLIVGDPGSGKTELLVASGRMVPLDESPVLIRCSSLDLRPGAQDLVLQRLVAGAEGLREDIQVSSSALTNRRFHFFLDGLDECPPERQADLARQIIALAQAFPQHRFSVTTRPIEAVELFPRTESAGWRALDLRPDREWQARYLEEVGVSLDALEAEMPPLRDLDELLYLPFFLARTVDLYREGRLGGLPDLWALVQELITASLERESDIPLPKVQARAWLADLALAMQLSGRVTLALDEVENAALPAGVRELFGTLEAVVEALVIRLLLQQRQGQYGFNHRILSEALAAEALSAHGVSDVLLSIIAPRVSETICGARNDWLMPLAFLLRRDDEWRQAIRQRDPLVAARSVPANASLEERRDAFRVIWDTYLDWKIWMWDRELGFLVQDHLSLGLLLQSDGMDGEVAEVRSAIDHPNAQVQGNAIRVLARLKPPWLIDELRRVLEDDGREAVIRRQAAIAARDIRAEPLLELIVERACHPADDAEAQDCSICAMDLAEPDRYVDTAFRLARSRKGYGLALSRLKRYGQPADLLRFLRLREEAEDEEGEYTYPSDKELLTAELQRLVDAPDSEQIADAAFVAGRWGMHNPALEQLCQRSPEAMLAGLVPASESHPGFTTLIRLTPQFSIDQLREAGAHERFLNFRIRHASHVDPPVPSPPEVEADPVPLRSGLSEALRSDRESADPWIWSNSQWLNDQVRDLEEPLAEDLRSRLEEWWPEKPYVETIRHESRTSWHHELPAATWVNFGPALDKSMTERQWAELAGCGVLFSPHTEWLQRHYTEPAGVLAAELCKSADAEVWSQLLQSLPPQARLPETLVEATISRLRNVDQQEHYLRYVAGRIQESHGPEPLQRLRAALPGCSDLLLPLLATGGDTAAQLELVTHLRRQVVAGEHVSGDDLNWMSSLRSEDFLDPLFECLRVMDTKRNAMIEGAGWMEFGALNQVVASIQNIGGEAAIDAYDKLIASGNVYAFRRLQRQALAQGVLQREGLTAVARHVGALGLPDYSHPSKPDGEASTRHMS